MSQPPQHPRMCSRCGANEALLGCARCKVCREKDRAYDAERRAKGACVDCRKKARRKGSTRCAACAKAKAKKARELSAARREAGQCVTCGAEAVEGLALCQAHREYFAAR